MRETGWYTFEKRNEELANADKVELLLDGQWHSSLSGDRVRLPNLRGC
jgi:hypothetical protein